MRTANAKSAHSSQYRVRSFGVSLGTQNPPPALAVARELGLGGAAETARLVLEGEAGRHPRRLLPGCARVHRARTNLLLDPHQLVVLCEAVRAARSARLDLAGAETNGQICNCCVFGLAGTMTAHYSVSTEKKKITA